MILHIGLKGTCTQIIEDAHTAASIGSGSLPVCATPVICALMEHAAVNSVSRCFPAGTTSVGVFLSVNHRAPTLTGHSVTACAELIRTEGRKLTFHIQVSDEGGLVAEADHVRVMVESSSFLEKAAERYHS